ncbi:MAG: dTMP kinase [Acidobacteriia bacterium]|nr:dTMP kinase [Terriglobia bacterium]
MSSLQLAEVPKRFYGLGLPYVDLSELKGKIIVIEGTDGVGRSTQIAMLRDWLEVQGFATMETGWTRSELIGQTIDEAKEGHSLNRWTFNLLYATDFADRLENQIIPALRAGYIVLADRYIYTAFARAHLRSVDPQWVRELFGFALVPDIVFYLKIDVRMLIQRVLEAGGMDYWESGQDLHPQLDMYESFRRYQAQLLKVYDQLAIEYQFHVLNARHSVQRTQRVLQDAITRYLFEKPGAPRSRRRPKSTA